MATIIEITVQNLQGKLIIRSWTRQLELDEEQ